MEIGRQLEARFKLPLFGRGVMIALAQDTGKLFVLKLVFKRFVKRYKDDDRKSFNTLPLILGMPEPL
jgi:hypothetical protein